MVTKRPDSMTIGEGVVASPFESPDLRSGRGGTAV